MSFQEIIDDYLALTDEETHALTDSLIEDHKTSNIVEAILAPVQQHFAEEQMLLMKNVAIRKLSLKQASTESREIMLAHLHAILITGRIIERLYQDAKKERN